MKSTEIEWIPLDLKVRNMITRSCLRLMQRILSEAKGIKIVDIKLGQVCLKYHPREITVEHIKEQLKQEEFPVITDKNDHIVEMIKIAAIELIHYYNNNNSLIRNSDYLSNKLGLPYSQLSKVFSEKTGITLEKYIIHLKIEKVKELIQYNELTLSEIAFQMGYSSVQYLSNQFKQVTGVTVSEYKQT
ncbi:MAG: helix-turn-helix transcriptional regulator, partial [Bacteroidia bacterium]|nr:helix-turn-helix transcriptional regulator [Bacteroidia bacterium]